MPYCGNNLWIGWGGDGILTACVWGPVLQSPSLLIGQMITLLVLPNKGLALHTHFPMGWAYSSALEYLLVHSLFDQILCLKVMRDMLEISPYNLLQRLRQLCQLLLWYQHQLDSEIQVPGSISWVSTLDRPAEQPSEGIHQSCNPKVKMTHHHFCQWIVGAGNKCYQY